MRFTFPILWTTPDLRLTRQNDLARRAFSLRLGTRLSGIDLPALQKQLERDGFADLLWTQDFSAVTFLVLQEPATGALLFLAPAPLQAEPYRSLLLARTQAAEEFCRQARLLFQQEVPSDPATAGARHRFAKRISAWQRI